MMRRTCKLISDSPDELSTTLLIHRRPHPLPEHRGRRMGHLGFAGYVVMTGEDGSAAYGETCHTVPALLAPQPTVVPYRLPLVSTVKLLPAGK
jgi:hypothetical protein